jgi:hypothetical protein
MNLEEAIIYVYLCVKRKYHVITGGCRIRAHGFNLVHETQVFQQHVLASTIAAAGGPPAVNRGR